MIRFRTRAEPHLDRCRTLIDPPLSSIFRLPTHLSHMMHPTCKRHRRSQSHRISLIIGSLTSYSMPSSFWQSGIPHPQPYTAGVNDAVPSDGRKFTPFCNDCESSPSAQNSANLGSIPHQMTQIERPYQQIRLPTDPRATGSDPVTRRTRRCIAFIAETPQTKK